MIRREIILAVLLVMLFASESTGQSNHWQKKDRLLHYTEDNGDFLCVNGRYRFNRALYGNNLASRVEAGDLPEFALYMPGMAGNLQFVIGHGDKLKKMIDADHIETRYRPGAMVYRVKDSFWGKGQVEITVMAQADTEGMIVKIQGKNMPPEAALYVVYGGASGKTFSRNGDIGADPESGFYLLPEYCAQNSYVLGTNSFELTYRNKKDEPQFINGSSSGLSGLRIADASALVRLPDITPPTLLKTSSQGTPMVVGKYDLNRTAYVQISKGTPSAEKKRNIELKDIYDRADKARMVLANRIKLNTPDRYINNFGAALAVAADAIWESPTFLHGAVAWRMRLNAWRGAYVADVLGWHDRAKEHFTSYAHAQVIEPANGPVVMDTVLHLARHVEKMGTSMFSSGYISRNPNNNQIPHHYDMNLVFIDQLLSHFNYTGDVSYIRQMWPTLIRHLHWEKRNFDSNNDGLYDAYCAIWASDGLQYSGGAVTHTSAYNYRANRVMAKLAKIIGEDPDPFVKEADKIQKALKDKLWIKEKGYFAEFQDALGNQLIHDRPGLWTIYHVADADLLDDFDNYQNVQYVNNYLPKIPIVVQGQHNTDLYTLPTTTWQPYTWSINNVALAENLQMALAYWQSGRAEEAFQLWKSNVFESMYYGISPANFQQLSHYDAFRGELYRDFADPIGVASRTLAEGLFGVYPQLLDKQLIIKPGFPADWKFAEMELPEWSYRYKKNDTKLHFLVKTNYGSPLALRLEVPVDFTKIKEVKVNGKHVKWMIKPSSINSPCIIIESEPSKDFDIEITGAGKIKKINTRQVEHIFTDPFSLPTDQQTKLVDIYDPQGIVLNRTSDKLFFVQQEHKGTCFIQLQQDEMSWWQAIDMSLVPPLASKIVKREQEHFLTIQNRSIQQQQVFIESIGFHDQLALPAGATGEVKIPAQNFSKGTNTFYLKTAFDQQKLTYTNWTMDNKGNFEEQNILSYYNSRLTDIFNQNYMSPRPIGPTLQLPWQGIGNWCYPLTTAHIDDSGLMGSRREGKVSYLDIPFQIEGDSKNVMFASHWDNYPTTCQIPLQGHAKKVYLLLSGSTNPMQSQLTNGKIKVNYTDGTADTLDLVNPINWWPIEQDYFDDNYAFDIPDERIPYRIKLQSGQLYKGGTLPQYTEIKGYTQRAVHGGAATLLDMPLDPRKQLQSLELIAVANDVVLGLIAATLLR